MIGRLAGKLLHKSPTALLVDVNGVGYDVTVPLSTFYQLPEAGFGCELLIHTYVREDTLQLYGFHTPRERQIFLKLIAVSGIGPKLAITILSGLSPEELITSLRNNDIVRLTAVPGIGRKTAERLVVELKDKLPELLLSEAERAAPVSGTAAVADGQVKEDVISALVNLGYHRALAERTVTAALQATSDHSTTTILKEALRRLLR